MSKYNNCVTEVYKGFPIRKYEMLVIRIDANTRKKIIDLAESTGLSEKKIVCNSSAPCAKCEGSFISVFDTNGNEHKIPRGIISKRNLL